MDRTRAYVETTIPSFYHDERKAGEIAIMRHWTRVWWSGAHKRYELVTSAAVLREIFLGPDHRQARWLELVRDLEWFSVDDVVQEIARTYIAHKLMPADPSGDALHLAIASYHRCDFLVTWNRRHLANANKFGHIRSVNEKLGLFVPTLVTPLQPLEMKP
jgi:predicted nucleic acid-binding protein